MVDNVIGAHIDTLFLGHLLDFGARPYIEADDDGIGGRGEQDIRFADGARSLVQHSHLDLTGGQLFRRLGKRFKGSLYVGADDHPQLLDITLAHLLEQLIQRNLAAGRKF